MFHDMSKHIEIKYRYKVVQSKENIYTAIYEKEVLTILHALQKWQPYLMGRHFKVRMDHDNLKYFLEQRLSSK